MATAMMQQSTLPIYRHNTQPPPGIISARPGSHYRDWSVNAGNRPYGFIADRKARCLPPGRGGEMVQTTDHTRTNKRENTCAGMAQVNFTHSTNPIAV
jgi:hypothetical protein